MKSLKLATIMPVLLAALLVLLAGATPAPATVFAAQSTPALTQAPAAAAQGDVKPELYTAEVIQLTVMELTDNSRACSDNEN